MLDGSAMSNDINIAAVYLDHHGEDNMPLKNADANHTD
jgi:hypothetical protein